MEGETVAHHLLYIVLGFQPRIDLLYSFVRNKSSP